MRDFEYWAMLEAQRNRELLDRRLARYYRFRPYVRASLVILTILVLWEQLPDWELIAGVMCYFAPTILAYWRRSSSRHLALFMNVFFAWTIAGWFFAWFLACHAREPT